MAQPASAITPVLLQSPTDGVTEGLLAGLGLLLCAFLIAYVGLYIWSLIFMYKDAKARAQNEVLWLVLGIFFFPITWIIWLIVRPKQLMAQQPFAYGQVPGMPPPPPPGYPPQAPGYGYPQPAQPYPAPAPYAPPAPYPPAGYAPVPAPAQPAPSVRCPSCQTVFAYQKNPSGPTRVKCPNCGTEGTL